jgi:nucleotide-binding universal stress UspA family protein
MNPQKVVIAMPVEDDFMPSISRWGHGYTWTQKEAYFVHVIKKEVLVNEGGVQEVPGRMEVDHIRQKMLGFVTAKAKELMPEAAFKMAHFEILLAESPADRLAEYAKEVDAGMVVVATRNKKGFAGLFVSSFADRLLKLSPCDVLIIRPR